MNKDELKQRFAKCGYTLISESDDFIIFRSVYFPYKLYRFSDTGKEMSVDNGKTFKFVN